MNKQEQLEKKFQKEINTGTAALILLSILSQSNQPMYGYQIIKLLEKFDAGEPIMNQSALYPVLRSLEKMEQITSSVEPSVTGPPRKYYHVTPAGLETLKTWIHIWQSTKQLVDAVLKGELNEKQD